MDPQATVFSFQAYLPAHLSYTWFQCTSHVTQNRKTPFIPEKTIVKPRVAEREKFLAELAALRRFDAEKFQAELELFEKVYSFWQAPSQERCLKREKGFYVKTSNFFFFFFKMLSASSLNLVRYQMDPQIQKNLSIQSNPPRRWVKDDGQFSSLCWHILFRSDQSEHLLLIFTVNNDMIDIEMQGSFAGQCEWQQVFSSPIKRTFKAGNVSFDLFFA